MEPYLVCDVRRLRCGVRCDVRTAHRRRMCRNLVREPERRDSDVRGMRRGRVCHNLVSELDSSDDGPKVMFDELFDKVMHKPDYSYFGRLYSASQIGRVCSTVGLDVVRRTG